MLTKHFSGDQGDELQNRYSKIDHALKNESNIVAGALYASMQEANRKHVDLTFSVQQALSGLPLSKHDLVALISKKNKKAKWKKKMFELYKGLSFIYKTRNRHH